MKSTRTSYLFHCDKCAHQFSATPYAMTIGKKCPYCERKELCNNPDCQQCWKLSFASHEKSKQWAPVNDTKPWQIFAESDIDRVFVCDTCEHLLTLSPKKVLSGEWCQYCAGKELCGDADCKICAAKSFASHWKSAHWSPANSVQSWEIFLRDAAQYWFICETCAHSFEMAPRDVLRGSWCPQCRIRARDKLRVYLAAHFPTYREQFRPRWGMDLETGHCMTFDFAVPRIHIVIEIDDSDYISRDRGVRGDSLARNRSKMRQAWQNGYNVIRLISEDLRANRVHFDHVFAPYLPAIPAGPTPLVCINCFGMNAYAPYEAFRAKWQSTESRREVVQ